MATNYEFGLIDWLEMLSSKNVDEMWFVLENKLIEVVLKITPIWRRRRNNKPSWWSKYIDKVRKRKKRWYNYRLSQNHFDLLKYKKALGTATKTICIAKRSYE